MWPLSKTKTKTSNSRAAEPKLDQWRGSESAVVTVVELLNLCDHNVSCMEELVSGGGLLNQRQCQDLATKLSKTTDHVRVLVEHCAADGEDVIFRPALDSFYRYLDKAKLLVQKCGKKKWWKAAVFQMQNENAFRDILLEVGLCYNAIYEVAKSGDGKNHLPPDLRQDRSVFLSALATSDIDEDKQELRERLEALATGQNSSKRRKQSLAKYLLVKMDCASKDVLDPGGCRAILWAKESEPSWTWGRAYELLGGGLATTVCSTKWMGVPCAKKVFKPMDPVDGFAKEASILAHLKHPCIVSFFCWGMGEQKGSSFIAMELMEMSLLDLIEAQKKKGGSFPLPVVVDIMVQIARGMCYLHVEGVANRDLKPGNVLLEKVTSPHLQDCFCVKLVDFGVSKIEVEVDQANTMTGYNIGTTTYRAPEILNMDRSETRPIKNPRAFWCKADVFSFAMTCAHLLSLKRPFEDIERPSDLYIAVKIEERRPELPEHCPEVLVALLTDCWNADPLKRPSFAEVCTRLEKYRHQVFLRGISEPPELRYPGFAFIERKLEEQKTAWRPLKPLQKVIGANLGETLVLHRSCVMTHSFQRSPKARLSLFSPRLPPPGSCLPLALRPRLIASTTPQYFTHRQIQPCFRSFYA